jgi:tetratricopeptide (TPR) repeat protein
VISSRQRPRGLVVLLLILATAAAYWSLPQNGFINFDDDDYVTKNPRILGGFSTSSVVWAFTAFHAGNWHPLTWLSHMLDVTLFGDEPAGHHVTNLVIHILNGLLLFFILGKTARVFWRAAFVAALFLLHPLHVESVAWLAERKDVLSTLFFLLTIWSYARYVERPGIARYLPTLMLFALGLLAKPMIVTLPCVLLLMDYWPFERVRFDRHSGTGRTGITDLVMEKAPFLALSLGSSMLTLGAQRTAGLVQSMDSSLPLRIANALVSYVSYVGKMFWPRNLAAYYPHPESIPVWKTAGAALFLVILTVLLLRAAKQRRWLAVGWLWFLGTLIPVLGLVHGGGQSMADRYTYIPLIGLFVILAWGAPSLLRSWSHRRLALAVVSIVVLSGCAALTYSQVSYWKDSVTLWEHTVEVTAGNFSAHNMLATALARQGNLDEALHHYGEALRINPEHERSHNNLGLTLARLGKDPEAIDHYREAVRINPRYEEAHDNLGLALGRQGDLDGAIRHFSEAVRIRPGFAEAHAHLGSALERKGDRDRAIYHYSRALRINPSLRGARLRLQGLQQEGATD